MQLSPDVGPSHLRLLMIVLHSRPNLTWVKPTFWLWGEVGLSGRGGGPTNKEAGYRLATTQLPPGYRLATTGYTGYHQ